TSRAREQAAPQQTSIFNGLQCHITSAPEGSPWHSNAYVAFSNLHSEFYPSPLRTLHTSTTNVAATNIFVWPTYDGVLSGEITHPFLYVQEALLDQTLFFSTGI